MSKERYEQWGFDSYKDNKAGTISDDFLGIMNQQDQQITDLEAKLAECEKSNEYFADRVEKADKEIKEIYKKYNKLVEEYNNLKEEVDNNFVDGQKYNELKQQLAEKDKEIEDLKASSDKNIDYLIEFASLIENEKDCNRMLKALDRVKKGKKYIVDKEHQDKISFCIEQLEQVKELAHKDFILKP